MENSSHTSPSLSTHLFCRLAESPSSFPPPRSSPRRAAPHYFLTSHFVSQKVEEGKDESPHSIHLLRYPCSHTQSAQKGWCGTVCITISSCRARAKPLLLLARLFFCSLLYSTSTASVQYLYSKPEQQNWFFFFERLPFFYQILLQFKDRLLFVLLPRHLRQRQWAVRSRRAARTNSLHAWM